jgi:outer membrane protein assembly factor BamB
VLLMTGAPNYVYVGNDNGKVYKINASDGTIVGGGPWADFGAGVRIRLITRNRYYAGGQKILIATDGGVIYNIDP